MYNDVLELRSFYQTSLGRVARRLVRRRLRQFWPQTKGLSMLGIGYTAPFMRPFLNEARRVINVMPAAQGVTFWPTEGPGCVALSDETHLPLKDQSMYRILVVHGIECTEKVRAMMREIWRVLDGNGRLLMVVPNRTGFWAMSETTPFGHGIPYSTTQVNRLLRDNLFMPERHTGALFMPPIKWRMLLGGAPAWEEVGARWLPGLCGVTIIEASKQLYAASGVKERATRPRRIMVPIPSAIRPSGLGHKDE